MNRILRLFALSILICALPLAGQLVKVDNLTFTAQPPPATSSIAGSMQGTTGANPLYYWVAVRYPAGVVVSSSYVRVPNTPGIAALGGPTFVALRWTAMTGATGYDVIRQTAAQWPGTCVACVVSVNQAGVTFNDAGGATGNWPSPGITLATAQSVNGSINNRDQAYPFLQWSGSPTVALAFPKIQTGISTSYFTGFTSGDNIWQIYATDSTSTGYTDGLQATVRSTGGAGAGAIRPINAVAQAGAGSDLSEAYGIQGWVDMTSAKGRVRDNAYGVIGYLDINTGFTVPTNFVQGVLGVIDSDVSLAGAAVSGAVTGDVKWGLITPNVDGAFVAFRDGGGAGGTQGAAFKLKRISTNSIDEFTYGLDLYGGAAAGGTGIGTASIRGELQSVFDNETALKWRSDSEVQVSGPALAALDWSARAGSVQGVGSRISANMATVTGLKGGDFRSTSIGGAAGTIIGAQVIATSAAGTVTLDEVYGLNGIANHNTGTATNAYGTVGLMNFGAGALLGATGFGIGALGVYDDQQGVNIATNYTAAVLGSIADRNTAGPDGAVVALLQGDSIRQAANNPVAAFKVIDRTTTPGVGFQYGLDLYFLNGAETNIFQNAEVRLSSQAEILSGTGVPAGGLCAAGNLGSIYINHGGGAGTSLYVCEVAGAWVGK